MTETWTAIDEETGEYEVWQSSESWQHALSTAIGLEVEYRQFLQSSPELTRTPTRKQWFRCEF